MSVTKIRTTPNAWESLLGVLTPDVTKWLKECAAVNPTVVVLTIDSGHALAGKAAGQIDGASFAGRTAGAIDRIRQALIDGANGSESEGEPSVVVERQQRDEVAVAAVIVPEREKSEPEPEQPEEKKSVTRDTILPKQPFRSMSEQFTEFLSGLDKKK